MKRDHPLPSPLPPPLNHLQLSKDATVDIGGSSSRNTNNTGMTPCLGKSKMLWDDETQNDGGVDELLAVLGYKVKSSDMAEVAQKLQQLEEVMGNAPEEGDVLSHLASDTVHYNPSDISNWLENMLSEINPLPNIDQDASLPSSSVLQPLPPSFTDSSHRSIYDQDSTPIDYYFGDNSVSNKRLKQSFPRYGPSSAPVVSRPVVLVDSQEAGIQLVHSLMACAEAIQQHDLSLAGTLVNRVTVLAASQTGAMRKVATYFAQGLAQRIFQMHPQDPIDPNFADLLQMHFYETSPYLKFAHFTANQAILEAFSGKNRVHVIDFSMNQGMQWPALMQALALRPGGPPAFRLTGIGPPSPDNTDRLQEVGWKLAQLAETIHVEFEYRGFVANSLADLDASMLELRPSEVESVAVNSVFELHRLLARPGAIEKVLNVVKDMKPSIVTVVEQEANHNGPVFLDRFTESLHYYSTLFDSLEGSVGQQDNVMSEVYLGKQILNVVGREGLDRVERHEILDQWRNRFAAAGFESVHLGSNAYRQASMLLDLFAGGDGYRVEENNGCLMLGWHTRPLITTSAWQIAAVAD